MELRDYLRAVQRRLWIVVLVPVLAVGASLGLTTLGSGGAKGYATTATVSAPPLSSSNSTVQYASDFQAVADSGAALDATAKATGVSRDTLDADLTVSRLSTSSLMQITYTTTEHNAAKATKVTQSYGQAILEQVYGAAVTQSKAQEATAAAAVAAAQKNVDASRQALNDFLGGAGFVRPDDALRTATSNLGEIQTQLDLAAVSGDSVPALQAALDAARKRLTDLGARAVQFTSLNNALTKSTDALDVATTDQETAAKAVAAATPHGTVAISSLESPVTGQTIRRAVAAGVIGLLLAIALVVLLDVRRTRRMRQATSSGPMTTPAGPVPTLTPSPAPAPASTRTEPALEREVASGR